ncbi:MAG: phosphate ABC transporter substrate-binding protein PstS [Polyangia bacterium]|jgi:phosphate transport system substrate-binding protein
MIKLESTGLLVAAVGATLMGPVAFAGDANTISGAGATFPYPVYSKWADTYSKETLIKLNYQAIGSGGGIKQITEGTVDFGASDAPLKPEELDKAGLIQFPVVMGGVVPVINVAGIKAGELKLAPDVLADIFLGKIKKWNDPRLEQSNPGLKLPDTAVTVVHRSDGSGTTWIFTNYLAKVSPEWSKAVGSDKSVAWPTGVGGKGNQGVASYVQRINGAIGYVESAYAIQNHMAHAKLKNHDGKFVDPTDDSVQAAAKGADWTHARSFYVVLTDQAGATSWPITGASFVLVHRQQKDADTGRAVLRFFDWGYRNGGAAAKELGYIPVPASVVDLVEKTWEKDLKDAGGQKLWPASKK